MEIESRVEWSCLFCVAAPKSSSPAMPWTCIFLSTSISSSTMCTLPNDPFVKLFFSLKKAFTRLLSPTPEFAGDTSFNIAHPSSAPPILMTQASTIPTANVAKPVTSKILFSLPGLKWTLIAHQIKSAGNPFEVPGEGEAEHSEQLLPISAGCVNLRPLSLIIGNTDIDFLSSHLPTSAPIASVLNVGLDSVGAGMTVACEIPLSLFSIMLMLTFIDCNLTVGQVEGPVKGVVDISSHIFTGSSLPKSLYSISDNSYRSSRSDVLMSLPISSALHAEVMPPSQSSYKYSLGFFTSNRPCRLLHKCSWHYKQHFSWKCEHRW